MITFTAETFQNEYLPAGGATVNAVVTVTASGAGNAAGATPATGAEVIIVDASGSMGDQRKIKSAQAATVAAIHCIRDGVYFAIIAGRDHAEHVYPPRGLTIASPATRAEAARVVTKLRARGGTAMGRWLVDAAAAFATVPNARHHAILLTDGFNAEPAGHLQTALGHCEGRFQCDCRGVGTDWDVSELREIASKLLGTVDIIPDAPGMAADFTSMMNTAMSKAVHDVALRVWTPQGAGVAFVKQVSPAIEDLTGRRAPVDPLVGDYPTGAWGDESRDYHLCIDVPPQHVGDEMLAGRVALVVDGEVVTQARLLAIWTDDAALSTRLNRQVAHYTGQAELADVIQDGLAAQKRGDEETATTKLGRAVQLAEATHDDGTLRLLARVVDIDDAPTGTVRLRGHVDPIDEMTLDTRSTKTTRVPRSPT
jgi:hypothetical protein